MKRTAGYALLALFAIAPLLSAQPAEGIPKTLLPLPLMRLIINEASGDVALQNEIYLAGVNRNRKAEEYINGYFEPKFLIEKLKEYGISDCRIIDLPTRGAKTWDAEEGELWIVKPVLRKIADLKDVAASLCSGSATLDVGGELVYVGPGNQERFYEGKDVKGKIVLVMGSPQGAQRLAVEKYGALGIIGYASSHPEFDPDEVGWNGINNAETMKPTIGFMVSERLGRDLRDQLERGGKIEVRAMAKTQMVPYKEQMVEAVLPGKDFPNEELVFSAHLFEGFAKQGANDNISGCVAILETARTLRKLMDDGKIPPLKRTVRFLFVPEISGTSAYLKAYPDIAKRFFANINEDMVGEGLIKNQSMLGLVKSPLSIPSYLNDVMSEFYEWMGTTQRNNEGREAYLPVWSPTGSRDPFYYVLDPYSGGSDHVVFVESGLRIPAVMLCVWPDQWYHTSGDTVDKADSTQLKRTAVLGAAAAALLAGAGPDEIEALIAEVGARSFERLGRDLARAEAMVRDADKAKIHDIYRDADNVMTQALLREDSVLASIGFFSRGDARLESLLKAKRNGLAGCRAPFSREIEDIYKVRCVREAVAPQRLQLSAEEIRLGKLIPERTEKLNGVFDSRAFSQMRRDMKDAPVYNLGRSESEVRNLIDGRRSILLIRNAVAAGGAAVALKDVETFLRFLEKTGYVKIRSI
jgi:aminopeptidase YwaD